MIATAVILTLLAIIVSTVLLIITKRPSSKFQALVDQIPGPPAKAVFGNCLDLATGGPEFYQQLLSLCHAYGRHTGILRLWVGYHVVAIITKAASAEVLLKSSRHMSKSFMYSFVMPWLGTGLLTSTGDKWHSRRKMITPSFHFKILEDFLQVFNEQTTVLQSRLDALVEEKKATSFDISSYITLCALDIICDSAMGQHVNAQGNSDSAYVKAIYKISELIMERSKSPWLWVDHVYRLCPAGRQHDRLLKILHGFTNKVIDERQTEFDRKSMLDSVDSGELICHDDKSTVIGKRKRLAFLDMLLHAAKSAKLNRDDIREEVDTFMFEGHDTTSAAANWAIYLIGSSPGVQAKLHQELDEIFGDSERPVTMEDVNKLTYMNCVIKESLRIFPSVPFIGREIDEDCNVGDYFVPKGSTALIMISVIHKDPTYFPDPEVFDPDRWLDSESAANRNPFAYIPFSAGLRNCIGQKFAMIEEKVILSSILRRFRVISLQTREELIQNGDVILRSATGIKVHLERRS